jgi:hypothetical protein
VSSRAAESATEPAELGAHILNQSYGRRVRLRLTRNPNIKSATALSVARRGIENNVFGSPHHKHDALATVTGLPHAEQTFTCLMEVFFLGSLSVERVIGGNVAVKRHRTLSSCRAGA